MGKSKQNLGNYNRKWRKNVGKKRQKRQRSEGLRKKGNSKRRWKQKENKKKKKEGNRRRKIRQHLQAWNKTLQMQMPNWRSSMNKKDVIMKSHYGWQKKVEEGWMNLHQVSKEAVQLMRREKPMLERSMIWQNGSMPS